MSNSFFLPHTRWISCQLFYGTRRKFHHQCNKNNKNSNSNRRNKYLISISSSPLSFSLYYRYFSLFWLPCRHQHSAVTRPSDALSPPPPNPQPLSAVVSQRMPHFEKPTHLALLGAPGVGKGTYARFIGPHYSLPFISTGDLVRTEIKEKTSIGQLIADSTSKGLLVPDPIIFSLLTTRLSAPDCHQGFLLDGFPRRISQAELLSRTHPLNLVINLRLRRDILLKKLTARRVCPNCATSYNLARIEEDGYYMPPLLPIENEFQCDNCHLPLIQREDDSDAVVRRRLEIYEEETAPLVEWYKDKGILVEFDVKRGVDDVPALLEVIDQGLKERTAVIIN